MKVGDKVRSFDFAQYFNGEIFGRDLEGNRASYVEGKLMSIQVHPRAGYDCYEILVDRDVFGGKEGARRVGQLVYPPVNGTPTTLARACDSVELIKAVE
jgi:hypothetical protein